MTNTTTETTRTMTYTMSRDVGCEITSDEYDRYQELVAAALAEEFEAEATVETMDLAGADRVWFSWDDGDRDLALQIAQDVWNEGAYWSTEAVR